MESYSLSDTKICGYFRAAVHFVFTKGSKLRPTENEVAKKIPTIEGFNDMKLFFGDYFNANKLEWTKFTKNMSRFVAKDKKWGKDNHKSYMEFYLHFAPLNWEKLNTEEKSKHTVICKECADNLLTKNKVGKGKQPTAPVTKKKIPQKELKSKCMDITNDLEKSFEDEFGASFIDTYKKCNKLEKKMSPEEKRQMKLSVARQTVKNIQSHLNNTNVDRLFGGKQSKQTWDFNRKASGFQTVDDARKRKIENDAKIALNKKKPKKHHSPFENLVIRTDELITLASQWSDDEVVNFQKIGRSFVQNKSGKIPGNCGQIVKNYLIYLEKEHEHNFNWKLKGKSRDIIRRQKLRCMGDKISVAVDKNSKLTQEDLNEEVRNGNVDVGVPIDLMKTYQKLKISKDNKKKEIQKYLVQGRKHPLIKLRIKLYHKHKKYMRLNLDSYFDEIDFDEIKSRLEFINEYDINDTIDVMKEKLKKFERKRSFKLWHDGSTIANHGHVLFCVSVLYDPAVFYTKAEYKLREGIDVNIQAKIEKPELYMIGRCQNNDDQLGFITSRTECLKDMSIKVISDKNIEISDVLRFFVGDGSAAAMESGNQKGGYFFCPHCTVHKNLTSDITYCFNQEIKSVDGTRKLVIKGHFGELNSINKEAKPFPNLNGKDLRIEITSRGESIPITLKNTKKDLKPILTSLLKGVQRVPIILYNNPKIDLKY